MDSAPLRGFFDLNLAAAALPPDPVYAPLIKLIDRSTHHLSVVEDLRVAVATLNTLITLGPGGPEAQTAPGDDMVRQSLFVNLVMLYSRATHSQDRGRPFKGGVLRGYSPPQKAAHERIIYLRDKVLAHHGSSQDQDWTDDRLILGLTEGMVGYRSVFNRRLLTREAMQDLKSLLPTALAYVQDQATAIEVELNQLVQDVLHHDQTFFDAVAASRFDPAAYFGSSELALAFEAGGETGTVTGHIRWTREPEDPPPSDP